MPKYHITLEVEAEDLHEADTFAEGLADYAQSMIVRVIAQSPVEPREVGTPLPTERVDDALARIRREGPSRDRQGHGQLYPQDF